MVYYINWMNDESKQVGLLKLVTQANGLFLQLLTRNTMVGVMVTYHSTTGQMVIELGQVDGK